MRSPKNFYYQQCCQWAILALILFFYAKAGFAQAPPSTGSSAGVDAIQMLINLEKNFPNLQRLVTAFCYVAGFVFTLRGIYYLKVYGELRTMMSTQSSLKVPMIYFLAASALLYLPAAMKIFTRTVFGYDSPLLYNQVASTMNPTVLKALFVLVNFIGLVSFIRGWFLLVAHAQQGGGQSVFGKALTHIVGGILLMNVLGVADILWNTFGFKFSL